MTILLQEIKDYLTKQRISFTHVGSEITFPISKFFITVEENEEYYDDVYFVNENEEAIEIKSLNCLLESFETYKLYCHEGFFVVRKSKDSVHASDGKTLFKEKSMKKMLAKIAAEIIVEEPIVEEPIVEAPVVENTFDAPVEMPKLERKVPQRKPRAAKVVKEKSETADEKPAVKKRKVSSGGQSIKTIVLDMITSDEEDSDIVIRIKQNFPESKFDINHVSWYRSTWFRDGIIEPKHAPRRSKVYKAWLRDSQKENNPA